MLIDNDYLNLKLEWITSRIEALDQIEAKLKKMKLLAEFARDYKLSSEQINSINLKIKRFQEEINELNEQSRTFWLDAH